MARETDAELTHRCARLFQPEEFMIEVVSRIEELPGGHGIKNILRPAGAIAPQTWFFEAVEAICRRGLRASLLLIIEEQRPAHPEILKQRSTAESRRSGRISLLTIGAIAGIVPVGLAYRCIMIEREAPELVAGSQTLDEPNPASGVGELSGTTHAHPSHEASESESTHESTGDSENVRQQRPNSRDAASRGLNRFRDDLLHTIKSSTGPGCSASGGFAYRAVPVSFDADGRPKVLKPSFCDLHCQCIIAAVNAIGNRRYTAAPERVKVRYDPTDNRSILEVFKY